MVDAHSHSIAGTGSTWHKGHILVRSGCDEFRRQRQAAGAAAVADVVAGGGASRWAAAKPGMGLQGAIHQPQRSAARPLSVWLDMRLSCSQIWLPARNSQASAGFHPSLRVGHIPEWGGACSLVKIRSVQPARLYDSDCGKSTRSQLQLWPCSPGCVLECRRLRNPDIQM